MIGATRAAFRALKENFFCGLKSSFALPRLSESVLIVLGLSVQFLCHSDEVHTWLYVL